MDEYWERVCDEVMQEEELSAQSSFTKLCQVAPCHEPLADHGRRYFSTQNSRRGPRTPVIYLGALYPQVYLTRREAHCALLVLKGLTLRGIAEELSLSARTIEYYMDNIKAKLRVRRRADVIMALLTSDFLANLRRAAEEVCRK